MNFQVEYVLNEHDEIIQVGQGWDEFAHDNDAPELMGSNIIGRPLLDFVSGNVTRQFVLALLHVARANHRSIELDYRCDSPKERRYMRMRLERLEREGLRVIHDTLRTEPRGQAIYIYRAAQRSRDTPVRCSMCNLVMQKDRWIDPELVHSCTLADTTELLVIYGICPSCKVQLEVLALQ
jgi:hypothetical protein